MDRNNIPPKNNRDDHDPASGQPDNDNRACLQKNIAVIMITSQRISRTLNFPSDISMVYLNNGNEPYSQTMMERMSKMICVGVSIIFDL